MASSSSRKSSSSASSRAKPTFRRASGAARPSSAPARRSAPALASAPSRKSAGTYAVPPARRKKVALPKAAPKRKPAAKPAFASRTVAASRPSNPVASPHRSRGKGRPRTAPAPAASPSKRVPSAPRGLKSVAAPHPSKRGRGSGRIATLLGPVRSVLSRLPLSRVGRGPVLIAVGVLAALAIAAVVVVNSSLFSATDITVNGSEHVSAEVAGKLVKIPDGATLLNVSEDDILAQLSANPWVSGVDIQRTFPHGLTITPVERAMKAVVYIPADDIAWGVGEDGAWIAPISLAPAAKDGDGAAWASVDADEGGGSSDADAAQTSEDGGEADGTGDEDAQPSADTADGDGSQGSSDADGDDGDQTSTDSSKDSDADQTSGADAAQAVAKRDGALLLTDVPSDISPRSGEPVGSETVEAGLEYAKGFSASFLKQIKSLSVPSVEAISATLVSGIEVSLGEPEDIAEKERVVTKLLEQEKGVTYINVREPGAYTFRSATS